jgi:hypothetical protein
MANTYFRYTKTERDSACTSAHLTAFVSNGGHNIQLTVTTDSPKQHQCGTGYITLSVEEQDALICGILERRGIHPDATMSALRKLPKSDSEITATGYEQSSIHPNY